MSEKRFVAIGVEWTDGFIQDHIGDIDLFNIRAVCNLLNDLSEENKQLKKLLECSRKEANDYCEELMGKDEFLRLYKEEIEQLKSTINTLTLDNTKMKKVLNTTKKENEELKQILNELSDMLQFDMENGIRSYPVKLSEYLSNALKELIK